MPEHSQHIISKQNINKEYLTHKKVSFVKELVTKQTKTGQNTLNNFPWNFFLVFAKLVFGLLE